MLIMETVTRMLICTCLSLIGWKSVIVQGLSFASYYGDHMVLEQSPKSARVWGYADTQQIGQTLCLELQDSTSHPVQKIYTTVTAGPSGLNQGIWLFTLGPVSERGPFSINVTLQGKNITLKDVLFGDVWICSGQSNMEFTVPQVFNASQELEEASQYTDVRVFTAAKETSDVPLYDLSSVLEVWSLPSKATLGGGPFTYFSAVCWLYGRYLYEKLKYPIGLIASSWGGTRVEAWSSPDALHACNIPPTNGHDRLSIAQDKLTADFSQRANPNKNSVLWNAMIHPFLNLTIHGAIWYQGEANADYQMNLYNCTFPAMIDDWRQKFSEGSGGKTDPVFPFGFVQLGAVDEKGETLTTGFPDIRWHQTADFGEVPNYRMKKVFMAVAMDLPDFTSPYGAIHPRDKQTVGRRLVNSALAVAYGYSIKYQGPSISAFTIDIGFFTLDMEFDDDRTPISVAATDGFEVCCSSDNQTYCPDGAAKWAPAPIISHNDNSVTVSWKTCSNMYIVGVRYAWRTTPCQYLQCPVYTVENNIPAAPFVTLGLIGSARHEKKLTRWTVKHQRHRPVHV